MWACAAKSWRKGQAQRCLSLRYALRRLAGGRFWWNREALIAIEGRVLRAIAPTNMDGDLVADLVKDFCKTLALYVSSRGRR